MIISGKTKSGFTYQLQKERLDNYELVESLVELEENPLVLTKIVKMILGKEQTEKLKEHLRTKDGLVSTEKMSQEIAEIFQNQKLTKNS